MASVYVGLFGYAGVTFWNPNPWKIPQVSSYIFLFVLLFVLIKVAVFFNSLFQQIVGGIFALVAIMVVPVGIYGLQKYFNFFPVDIPGFYQASAMVIANGVFLYFVPWPFLTAPLSWALFFITG